MKDRVFTQELGNVVLIYVVKNGITSFTCLPIEFKKQINEHRLLKDDNCFYKDIDSANQFALRGDGVERDFSAGQTLLNSETALSFELICQTKKEMDGKVEIRTLFESKKAGLEVTQVISQVNGYDAFEIYNIIKSKKDNNVLEKISSFSLSPIFPLEKKYDANNFFIHKIANNWSSEGRLITMKASQLCFEDSWAALEIKVDRFGSIGSMPARGFLPFIAFEDRESKVSLAIQLEARSSWQIESAFKYGGISVTGGQADYLFGHFSKTLNKGETFVTTKALIAIVNGDLNKACEALTTYHNNYLEFNELDDDLPYIFNEYCTSWGNPTIDNIKKEMKVAKELTCDYFVCDAGWYAEEGESWTSIGDWNIAKTKFPNGLNEFVDLAKQNGFKASGLWFEFEGVADTSKVFKKHQDWLLRLNGQLIKRKNRCFLDFKKPEVISYLDEKVLKTLKTYNIKYIKVDYNENIGLGIDGSESIGEGLREHQELVFDYLKKIKKEIPGIVIEICSSGGMRNELSFDYIGSMVSFSDAHETKNGAIIAMDLHRVMQPRIMQIWASFRPEYTIDDIYFHLAKAMLGRVCLSGQIFNLNNKVIELVKESKAFYDLIKGVIKHGKTILIDTSNIYSLLEPRGSIRLIRKSLDESEMVCYAFDYDKKEGTTSFDVNGYKLVSSFGNAYINDSGLVSFKNNVCSAVIGYYKKG